PELAAIRGQHGIASAGLVIADTYPFNPVWEGKVRDAEGPISAGITNRVSNENKVLIDGEGMGQRRERREGASAALSRTDWEIAFQEVVLGVRVIRAFDTMVYRQEKLQLVEKTIALNEEAVETVRLLVEKAQLNRADLVLIRTEVADARS